MKSLTSALFFFFDWLIDWLLCWVISVLGLPLVAASGGHSSSRCAGLSLSQPLVAEHRSQTRRLSSCGSRAQSLPRHVGSSQTRARTRVPRISRQALNHCATREAHQCSLKMETSPRNFVRSTRTSLFQHCLKENKVFLQYILFAWIKVTFLREKY